MLVCGRGVFTPEHEKKMWKLQEMIKSKLKPNKIGFCVVVFPKKLDGKWEICGSVIVDWKDYDYEAVFKGNKLKIKKTPYVDYTDEILKKMGRSQKHIDNLNKIYIAHLKKEGYPQKYIDNLKKK